MCCFFFFQAEDGIRDLTVTGVQTCALPISGGRAVLSAGEAQAERLECLRDRAHIGDAAQQPVQEDRALRAHPGGVVAGDEKGRGWGVGGEAGGGREEKSGGGG